MPPLESRHISTAVDCPYDRAYAFLAAPENFAQWAAGLGQGLRSEGDRWIAQTPGGPAEVRFTLANEFGVLDHWVRLPDGLEVYVPMRVIPSGDGCEVTLTLLRLPAMSDEKFREDAAWVARDLATLKAVLESQG